MVISGKEVEGRGQGEGLWSQILIPSAPILGTTTVLLSSASVSLIRFDAESRACACAWALPALAALTGVAWLSEEALLVASADAGWTPFDEGGVAISTTNEKNVTSLRT